MTTEKRVPSLLLQIQTKRDMLTAAELRVADYILAHPESVLQLSVAELAAGSGTSDATVTRSIRKLGMNSYNEMRPGLGAPLFFHARTVGGVNFVSIDNSYHQFEPWQLTRLQKEIKKGLPIILCLHAPLFEQSLYEYHCQRTGTGSSSYLVGCDEDHLPNDEWRAIEIRPRGITAEAVDFIKSQKLIKAVLAGHVHFSYVSDLAPGMTQFVTGGGYEGVARELTII